MSIKIIRSAPASPAASGPAAQESRASQRSRRPSIFSNLSFANAPKNNSVSMGPRIKTPSQPSSQALATSRPAVHCATSERNTASMAAKSAERAPLGAYTGNVRQPAARPRPAAGGAENADPNVGRLSPHAAVKTSMPTLVANFSTDRPLTPKQLVAAMVNLTKGTDFEGAVSQTIANE